MPPLLDLTKREQLVFDVLKTLKLGRTAGAVARKARVARTTCLYILEKFERLKLVRKNRVESHTYWRLEPYKHLARGTAARKRYDRTTETDSLQKTADMLRLDQ